MMLALGAQKWVKVTVCSMNLMRDLTLMRIQMFLKVGVIQNNFSLHNFKVPNKILCELQNMFIFTENLCSKNKTLNVLVNKILYNDS